MSFRGLVPVVRQCVWWWILLGFANGGTHLKTYVASLGVGHILIAHNYFIIREIEMVYDRCKTLLVQCRVDIQFY